MKFFTLLFTLGWTAMSFSQTYTFATLTAGYYDLVVPTSLNNGQTWDDPNYNVPIGFTFEYFGESMTSIEISDDGLGGILKSGSCATDPGESYLIAYGADIIDRGDDGPVSLSNISHKTEGTVGSRICKIEWRNVGFYSGSNDVNGNRIDYLNFQLWLYETSNVIEIHFGPKSITEALINFEDETGSSVGLMHHSDCTSGSILGHQIMLDGTPVSPSFYDNVYSFDDTLLFLDGSVPSLTVYRFTPASTASQEELISMLPFSIVPNPAENQLLLVREEDQVSEITNAVIVDMNGKILLSDLAFNQKISISHLHSGMYFIQVEMKSGERYSEKFTKL